MIWALVAPLLGLLPYAFAQQHEQLKESLTLEQYPNGNVFALFNFTTTADSIALSNLHGGHYSLLPRAIGEIIRTYGVEELHLTFTQGRWQYSKWGYNPASAGTGVQFWAWLNGEDVDLKWKGLTNSLAGVFCASLNFIDQSNTAEPVHSFEPEGSFVKRWRKDGDYSLRYGSLPREITCTENLTPWVKLLPCQAKAGIAKLFNAYRLYDSDYHSMSIKWRTVCEDYACTSRALVLSQTVSVVLSPKRFPLDDLNSWSLNSLFERSLKGSCPLASTSEVNIRRASNVGSEFSIIPALYNSDKKLLYATFDLKTDTRELNLGITNSENLNKYTSSALGQQFLVSRHLTGFGQERGGFLTEFRNNDPKQSFEVVFFEAIPWFLKLYLHTLRFDYKNLGNSQANFSVLSTQFQPAIDRVRPSVLELFMRIPPQSHVSMRIDFDIAFLKYTEYPPDANRGFDVSSSVVTVFGENGTAVKRLFTENVLIALPTPDFSMPYNVITMTCTVMALFFGSLFNVITRQFTPVRVNGGSGGNAISRLLTLLRKRRKAKAE